VLTCATLVLTALRPGLAASLVIFGRRGELIGVGTGDRDAGACFVSLAGLGDPALGRLVWPIGIAPAAWPAWEQR